MKIGDQEIIRLKMEAQSEDWETSFIPCRFFDLVACKKERKFQDHCTEVCT